MKYRIIVCTLVSAARFIDSRDRRNNHTFTHLFIDEAGQAAESEALIAIGGLLEKPNWSSASGQLVNLKNKNGSVMFLINKPFSKFRF